MPSRGERSLVAIDTIAQQTRKERLWAFWPYAEGRARDTIQALLEEIEANPASWSPDQETSFLACASTTWPIRQAIDMYAQEYPEHYWNALLKRVRPTTLVLLKRLQEKEETTSLDKILRSPLAAFALFPAEQAELTQLHPWILVDIWQRQKNDARLQELISEKVEEREEIAKTMHGKTSEDEWSAFEQAMVEG